jgi:bacteriocin-like protein
MGKRSQDKYAKDELSEQDLNKVSGGESFDLEQVLNIGSQSTGTGKIGFNPFSITRK